ncbi:MAG: Calx-beta domain-containing protein [Limisphaerales bacterium]
MNFCYPSPRCRATGMAALSMTLMVMWMLPGSASAGAVATNSVYSISALNADQPETDSLQAQTNNFVFRVTRGGDFSVSMASVEWRVTPAPTNSADAQDFEFGGVLPGGVLNFVPGQLETNVVIRIRGDLDIEPDEAFNVILTNAAFGGEIGMPSVAMAIIRNDDGGSGGDTTNSLNQNIAFSKSRGHLDLGAGGGVSAGSHHLTGAAFGKGFGLVSFGDGSPTNGTNYSNLGGDIGVNVDGQGILSGFAFSRSHGVIQFNWPGAGSTNNPRVDRTTGKVTGSAFSPAIGWVDFGIVTVGTVNTNTNSIYAITVVNADRPETDNPQTQTNLFVFKISRTGGTNATMASVGWRTHGVPTNSANGQDFEFGGVFPGGNVNFAPGQTETNIAIRVRGDLDVESDEHFVVALTNAAPGGMIGSPNSAGGVIRNDDSSSGSNTNLGQNFAFSKTHGFVDLGAGGGVSAGANYLSGWAFGKQLGWINFGDGSPTNGTSYSNLGGNDQGVNVDTEGHLSGSAFTPSIGLIRFDWPGATASERPRIDRANGRLTGRAFNPTIGWLVFSTAEVSGPTNSTYNIEAIMADKPETDDPHTQTNLLTFRITRTGNTNAAMAGVGWRVHPVHTNSADGQDFEFGGVFPGGVVNFAPGQLETNIAIRVRGDLDVEVDEGFAVALTNATSGDVIGSTNSALGLIRNDDVASTFTISPVDADRPETDDPLTQTNLYVFKISRSGNTNHAMAAIGYHVASAPTNSANGFDFNSFGVFPGGSVFFAPGQTETNVAVRVNGDLDIEGDEAFLVTLTNAAFGGVIGSPASAMGIIRNDDMAPAQAPPLLVLRPTVMDSFNPQGAFRFEISGNPGVEYIIEAANYVDAPPQLWFFVASITGNGSVQVIEDSFTIGLERQFYRVTPLSP